MSCCILQHHFFLPESFPQSVPASPVTAWPALALGLRECSPYVLPINEVFVNLRLGPQRPLELALWDEAASSGSGVPGAADGAGAFEGSAGQTQEQEPF